MANVSGNACYVTFYPATRVQKNMCESISTTLEPCGYCGAVSFNPKKRESYIKDCDGQGFSCPVCDTSCNDQYSLTVLIHMHTEPIFKCKSPGCLQISRHKKRFHST